MPTLWVNTPDVQVPGPTAATLAASEDVVASGDATAYLTPDALMAYCKSRLRSIDDQVYTAMYGQKQIASETSQVQAAMAALQKYSAGTSSKDDCTSMEIALHKAIEQIKDTDSNCPELPKLRQIYNDLVWSGTGPTENTPYEDNYPPNQVGGEGDHILSSSEVSGFINSLQGCASDLNSSAELNMIQIQSLMSQRQTAVQLTTNLVQSLGDQANKIAANIGH